jgi:hypothetical protein
VSGVDVRITGVQSATRFTDNARQVTTYRLGRSAPDLPLADGTTLAAHLYSGRGLLLGLGGLPSDVDTEVPVVSTTSPDSSDLPGLLVRPDGIVAWAGGDGLSDALVTWFGHASEV